MTAANVTCCGRACDGVTVRELYDGPAFWACIVCGASYRRWNEYARPDIAARVDVWAAKRGIKLREPKR